MKALASFWLTAVIVLALLAWLWATRETIRPSLIMSLQDVLWAKAAADKPSFCKWNGPDTPCRVS
jgi:hypothetical protein